MGHLNQDACPITGVGLATTRAAMVEVQENLNSLLDDGVGFLAFDIGDESDAAGIMLELWIVKALFAGRADAGWRYAAKLRWAGAHQVSSR